jgi:hypothetical protein
MGIPLSAGKPLVGNLAFDRPIMPTATFEGGAPSSSRCRFEKVPRTPAPVVGQSVSDVAQAAARDFAAVVRLLRVNGLELSRSSRRCLRRTWPREA